VSNVRNTAESDRLDAIEHQVPWRQWGPYLSERQWGTVREDYSANGAAWDYFPHDHARSRAYRWGEDGLGGFSDQLQRLCIGIALWNGRDPILKERLFGLTNGQGNHGEDVKELYYYIDATPSHSYLRMLYKYPQGEYPYQRLIDENRRRGADDPEFELLDTGLFEEDRYFDVSIEYAKAGPEDILLRVTLVNRGPEAAPIHVLPQAWFRNTWSWGRDPARPTMRAESATAVEAVHPTLGTTRVYFDGHPELLFAENETNTPLLFGTAGTGRAFKDGFHERVIRGRTDAVNADRAGTKAAAWYQALVPAGGTIGFQARISASAVANPFDGFAATFATRIAEADAFYADIQRGIDDADARSVQRQAFAGMIWSKQLFYYDVPQWIEGDPGQPAPPAARRQGRNRDWEHLNNADILSMPDAWEYPWFAAWDLAFHCIPLALIDPEFAKQQLVLLTREWYMHPNGQLPAYEWAFGDVNPPVHAWAAWRVFQLDRKKTGREDIAFLERVFHKLMLNFTWWVNRKDAQGRNVFQGGFLGLDNIGVFDRGAPLPGGGFLNQADGTAWMAMYSLNLMRIALELAMHNRVYEDIATKFFEHFLHIAEAMTKIGGETAGLWNEEDQFYYDVLNPPDNRQIPLKIRSMVGLIPLFAVETIDQSMLDALPDFAARLTWFLDNRPELAALVAKWDVPGHGERRLLSLVPGNRIRPILERLLDETEFLSDYGVRAISRFHRDRPYQLQAGGQTLAVRYQPGESDSGLFGGNSNWRGPIWMPVNYLLIESLQKFHYYYHDQLMVECPKGSGRPVTIDHAAAEISARLTRIFLAGPDGKRPVLGYHPKLQGDPHFRDHVLFHEYFHGDSGRGVGASHQTGWTGLVAKLLMPRSIHRVNPADDEHHHPTPRRRTRPAKETV
jgi:hypothetical protein